MTLALIGTITLLATWLVEYWRRVEARNLRWKFYALRDELRAAAVDDPLLSETAAFKHIDQTLSVFTRFAPWEFSLWSLIPVRVLGTRPPVTTAEVVAGCHNPVPAAIVRKGGRLIIQCLALRHFLIVLLLALTGVGLVPLLWAYGKAKERVDALLVFGGRSTQRREDMIPA